MKIMKRLVLLLIVAAITATSLTVTSFAAAQGWFSQATALKNGKSISGKLISDGNKDDYYKVTLKRSGYILLEVSTTSSSTSSPLYIHGFNSNGGTLDSKCSSIATIGEAKATELRRDGTKGARAKFMYNDLEAGVYYFDFNIYFRGAIEYTITPHFYETKDCFENSQALTMDSKQTAQLDVKGEEAVYRFNVNKNGTFKLNCVPDNMNAEFTLFKDEETGKAKIANTTGTVNAGGKDDFMLVTDKFEKSTATYDLTSGTYYLRVKRDDNDVWGSTVSFTPSFKASSSKNAKGEISYLSLTVKKGSEFQLGTVMSEEGDVTWSSSKEKVATVSKTGKIVAKKKGTAIITAKTGTNSMKIKITVS